MLFLNTIDAKIEFKKYFNFKFFFGTMNNAQNAATYTVAMQLLDQTSHEIEP